MNEAGDGCKIYRMNEISYMFCDREINKFATITLSQINRFDIAKRGVEMAIEKNESTAEKWIKEEIKKADIEI